MGDMDDVIVAKSDQVNAIDLLDRTKIIKITATDVDKLREQPVHLFFEGEPKKPYKPCLTMRRVLRKVWGSDSKTYIGKSLELFREAGVTWGNKAVGGIRIMRMSHIERATDVPIQTGKGKIEIYRVEPLIKGDTGLTTTATKQPEKKAGSDVVAMPEEEFAALKKDVFGCLNSEDLKAVYNRILDNAGRMTSEQKAAINEEYKATKTAVEKSEG